MPRPVEALPCGSRSITRTFSPTAASAVPRLIAVVVLPTPPFWLAIASTRSLPAPIVKPVTGSSLRFRSQCADQRDPPFRVCQAWLEIDGEVPGLPGFLDLRRHLPALQEHPDGTRRIIRENKS